MAKRNDLLKLQKEFESITDGNLEFKLYTIRLKKLIEEERTLTEQVLRETFPQKFLEYEAKVKELISKYNGELKNNIITFPDSELRKKYEEEVSKLEEGYKDTIQEYQEYLKKEKDFLNNEISLNLPKIKKKDIPDSISIGLLEFFVDNDLIEEDSSEKS